MRVALIGLRLSVGNRLMAGTLAVAFRRLGVEVVFVGDGSYTPPEGVPTIAATGGFSYAGMFRDALRPGTYRTAIAALKDVHPDVCYFVSVHPANAGLAWGIRRHVKNDWGRPPRIAMHVHDPLPHPGIASAVIFATQQLQVRFADCVVVYGAELARQIQRYYLIPVRRIAVIRHGAYRPPRETPPVDAGTNGGYRWFSFLGRIEPYKGLEVFLAAADELRARDPLARFYIGGTGKLEAYQSAIDALGTDVTVEHRELTNEETDDVMRSSWAVVLPYNSATQSGVIPVAYWNACPVIATGVGALREVVRDGETGFIVDRGDSAAVVERMRQISGNVYLRGRLGGGAFSFYDRWLRWERIASDLLTALSR